MKPETHRYLDGEWPRDMLPPDGADEARAWETLLERSGLRETRAPAGLEARVMRALPAGGPAPALRRAARWLLQPRSVRVRPVTAGLAAAALAALLLVRPTAGPPERTGDAAGPPVAGVTATPAPVYVQFTLSAPAARTVAVAGDFNGWSASTHLLRDPDGDGVWTVMVPLAPGIHEYMFVVDDERWVTDPRAADHLDDGFGMRNAVITVTRPSPGRSS